jgi:hypothetical protein
MRLYNVLQPGTVVKVINSENHFYGLVCRIAGVESGGQYFVNFCDKKLLFLPQEIVPWLEETRYKELYKAHLIQLQILAVDIGDRQWFDEIVDKLKELKNQF